MHSDLAHFFCLSSIQMMKSTSKFAHSGARQVKAPEVGFRQIAHPNPPIFEGACMVDYKQSGVDVVKGDQFVDWIGKTQAKQPFEDQIISGVGGFAAIFKLGFSHLKKPCIVSATDGVGTKVKLASQFKVFDSVGQDLVAMCVNDLICCGAQPLFFLDYYASAKLDLDDAKSFLSGVRSSCHQSGCALIGGETAEMPGVYHDKDFDCAGFAIGIVDEDKILGPKRVQIGDIVIGIESSGFHSNGYSLVRKIFEKDLEQYKDQLLKPTILYPEIVLPLIKKDLLNALAHITGGGMENIPRVMPKFTRLRLMDWSWPDLFLEAQDRSGLSRVEMLQTFNCGMGFCLIVKPSLAEEVIAEIAKNGLKAFKIGEIEKSENEEAEVIY